MADLSSLLGGIDLSSVLSKALSDPSFAATLAGLASGLRKGGQANPPESEPKPEPKPQPDPSEAVAALLPMLGKLGATPPPPDNGCPKGGGNGGGRKGDPRCSLLLALKPYLSKSRCEAIDRMVQVSKIGGLIGQMPAGKREEPS